MIPPALYTLGAIFCPMSPSASHHSSKASRTTSDSEPTATHTTKPARTTESATPSHSTQTQHNDTGGGKPTPPISSLRYSTRLKVCNNLRSDSASSTHKTETATVTHKTEPATSTHKTETSTSTRKSDVPTSPHATTTSDHDGGGKDGGGGKGGGGGQGNSSKYSKL